MSLRSAEFLTVVIILFFLAGSITSADISNVSDDSMLSSGEQSQSAKDIIAASYNKFSNNLFLNLSKDPLNADTNLFFSPFSIFSALAVTYEGARNSTADEMRSVLFLPENDLIRRNGYSTLNSIITSPGIDNTLTNGNALWVEKTYPVLPQFLDTSQIWYDANVSNLDFVSNPSGSAGEINRWVEGKTADKIQKLIDPDSLSPDTRLILTNAIYFKGSWAHPFDKNLTQDDLFNVSSGESIPVKMMHNGRDHSEYQYTENDDLQVLALPYAEGNGRHLSMVILLPKMMNMTAAESAIDPDAFNQILNSMTLREVEIALPKFTIQERYGLSHVLSSLGMADAFSEMADFSGIDGARNLYISDVVHSACLDVNEEGTEAAAGTGVVLETLSIEKNPVFRANHPFIFLIRDSDTGTILFIGKEMNPAS